MKNYTEKELTANFDHIYIISVPHQMPSKKLTFWNEQEIIDYATEQNIDWEVKTVEDAIDCIRSDWNSCEVIRNIEDCFWVWKSATHKAGEIRSHIINIINDDTDIYLEDYEDAEKFMAAIEPTCKEIL
jgi:hypothetical protein